jgi:predicted GTPase
MESSFDLMVNPLFSMEKRANWMMPTPFVLTDAVIIKKKIKPSPKTVKPIVLNVGKAIQKDSVVIEKDSLRNP